MPIRALEVTTPPFCIHLQSRINIPPPTPLIRQHRHTLACFEPGYLTSGYLPHEFGILFYGTKTIPD